MNDNYISIGLIKTLIICLYDILLLFSILFFLSFPFVIIYGDQSFGENIFYRVYLAFIIIFYYSWFWMKQGQTLGMKSWKVFLLNDNEDNITLVQCLIRIFIALAGGHITMLLGIKSLQSVLSKTTLCQKK